MGWVPEKKLEERLQEVISWTLNNSAEGPFPIIIGFYDRDWETVN